MVCLWWRRYAISPEGICLRARLFKFNRFLRGRESAIPKKVVILAPIQASSLIYDLYSHGEQKTYSNKGDAVHLRIIEIEE